MTTTLSVLVLPAFDDLPGVPGEATPWYEAYDLSETVEIAGVDEPLRYNEAGLGVIPTGIGKQAATGTTTAVLTNSALDLSETLFVTAGVAGAPPSLAIGSVVVANAIVDWDNKCRFDEEETEAVPLAPNPYTEGQGVFQLADELAGRAKELGETVTLDRLESVPQQVPDSPTVTTGTNVCGDELWHGEGIAKQVEWLISNVDADEELDPYRVTQMEDAGTAYALSQFDALSRYVSIRGIANYDRPLGSESPRENFFSDSFESGFAVGLENAVRVARQFVDQRVI